MHKGTRWGEPGVAPRGSQAAGLQALGVGPPFLLPPPQYIERVLPCAPQYTCKVLHYRAHERLQSSPAVCLLL